MLLVMFLLSIATLELIEQIVLCRIISRILYKVSSLAIAVRTKINHTNRLKKV
jgi:hypothetical protein